MKKFLVLLSILSLFVGCNKDDNPVDDGAKEGGLFEVLTSAIIYNLGDMDKSNSINLKFYQGAGDKIKQINMYQQFFTTNEEGDPISSELKLFKSVDVSAYSQPGYITTNVSFLDLAKSTILNGAAIDTIDTDLKSGFYWEISYKAIMEDGREVSSGNKKTIFVNAKFAGNYDIVVKKYYRIGVLRDDLDADWESSTNISALNATTYILGDYIGPFPGAGVVIFSIEDDGSDVLPLKYYKTYPGYGALLINGQPMAICPDDAGNLSNVGCNPDQNILKRGAGGKDTLIMSFGYVTPGSGPREFYQKLIKQ